MTIVINTQSDCAYNNFIIDSFIALAQQKPNYQFLFISKLQIADLPNNCKVEIVKKIPKTKIALRYWHNYKIASLLKKNNATHYFSIDGIICNRTNIPQAIFLSLPTYKQKNILPPHLQQYYGRKASKLLSKAKQIITFTTQEKELLGTHIASVANKPIVLPLAANSIFTPLFWEYQDEVKQKYTNGSSYFLAYYNTITKNEFTTLLKAFTQFKLWQRSSMNLIVYSSTIPYEVQDLYNTYKYKADVNLITNLSLQEYANVLASAYAFIYTDTQHYLPLPLLEAMQCQVPTIISNKLNLLFIDTSALVDFTDIKSIEGQMILIYKDENFRNDLISKGLQFVSPLNAINTVNTLEESIK